MLRRMTEIQWSRVFALDGEVGKVCDACFDERSWILRYFIVDTGGWLSGRKVPLDPRCVALIDRRHHMVRTLLKRARIESSPRVDVDKPVSRLHEIQLNRHYGYTAYWTRSMPWAGGSAPASIVPATSDLLELEERRLADTSNMDTHLRGARDVLDYTLITYDGQVGMIKDLLFDDETWVLRHLIVKTGSWLTGRRVVVGSDHVRRVDRVAQSVELDQTLKQIEQPGASPTANMSAGRLCN